MKKILLLLSIVIVVLSVSSCKKGDKKESVSSTKSITESEIFDNKGSSSEYSITNSEFGSLITKQKTEEISSGNKSTVKNNESSENTESVKNTSSEYEDKNNDGWTDEFR